DGSVLRRHQMASKLILIILSILLPPVAVFLKSGVGKDLVINILLCLLFIVPGVIHALWVSTR
ncbi:MAG: uncharacterized membrane protein YqaE (UPF0057 family), partial [Myxococcota bacterium]